MIMARASCWLLALCLSTVLGACGLTQSAPARISINILAPQATDILLVAQPGTIRVGLSGPAVQVRVIVDGDVLQTISVPQDGGTISAQWTPITAGQHIIMLDALGAGGVLLARSEPVIVRADPPKPALAAMPTVVVAPTSTSIVATPIAVSTPLPPATSMPSLILQPENDYANLRAGPGTDYTISGRLDKTRPAAVIGKNAEGTWWQVRVDGTTGWVIAALTVADDAARAAPVVQVPAPPTPPAALPAAMLIEIVPTPNAQPPAGTPAPIAAADAGLPPCNPDNPWWGVRIHNDAGYTFCVPVAFQFVPNANPDQDVLVVKWHIYGDFAKLELRMDPNGSNCGVGKNGFREQVKFKEDGYIINTRFSQKAVTNLACGPQ